MKYIFPFFCIFLIACGHPSRLEQALRLAGDNRPELEKVIAHYSADEADSLKLKAAIFLIENMPGHFSCGGSMIENYKKEVDAKYPDAPYFIRQYAYGIPIRNSGYEGELIAIPDITNIKADYLIRNIDNAFAMWQGCFWLHNVNFDNFCEYILPYRVDNEPLIDIEPEERMWPEAAEVLGQHDMTLSGLKVRDLMHPIWRRQNEIRKEYEQRLPNTPMLCVEKTMLNTFFYRTHNIASYDHVPCWGNHGDRHLWTVDMFPIHKNTAYLQNVFWDPGKIYRRTFSHNPIPKSNGRDVIPVFFMDPFNKDVTEKYMEVGDLTIKLDRKARRAKNIYLSVFNDLEWKPTSWAEAKGNKAVFGNTPKSLIYMPTYFSGETMHTVGYPLYFDMDANTTELKPDTTDLQSVRIYRKFPQTTTAYKRAVENRDVRLEASNDINFKTFEVIHEFVDQNPHMGFMECEIDAKNEYRYWRLSKDGRLIEMAELELIDSDGNVITGKTIQKNEDKDAKQEGIYSDKYDALFDGEFLTFISNKGWVGLDAGDKVDVKKVRAICRTDGNYIIPGQTFELFYWGDNGWTSLGQQVPKEEYLDYDNLPHNALFWLRNLSHGKEERIFTVNNGKVRWY